MRKNRFSSSNRTFFSFIKIVDLRRRELTEFYEFLNNRRERANHILHEQRQKFQVRFVFRRGENRTTTKIGFRF